MCGASRHRGGSDGRKALVPESRGAGTGAPSIDWPREAPAGRDRRGFPMSVRRRAARDRPAALDPADRTAQAGASCIVSIRSLTEPAEVCRAACLVVGQRDLDDPLDARGAEDDRHADDQAVDPVLAAAAGPRTAGRASGR